MFLLKVAGESSRKQHLADRELQLLTAAVLSGSTMQPYGMHACMLCLLDAVNRPVTGCRNVATGTTVVKRIGPSSA
jgi:hypothetical protein